MARRLVLVLLLWDAVSPQPVTEHASARAARQAGECCPCPEPGRALPSLDEECPCLARAADSDGAASGVLPRVLRPFRPDVMPTETKEDVKPLLHPEVDLASSVLQTLRDATDEELREAAARDAARADGAPDAADRVVTIVLSPKPDSEEDALLQEASHAQETRCAPPLASRHSLPQVRPHRPLLAEPLSLPKLKANSLLHRNDDMDLGASSVQEQVDFSSSRVPDLRLSPRLNKLHPGVTPVGSTRFEYPTIPKLRLNAIKKADIGDFDDFDNNPSPSNAQEQFSEFKSSDSPKFGLKSLLKIGDRTKRPLSLDRLWKLKDVELIPPKTNKPKINIPSLKLTPTKQHDQDDLSSFGVESSESEVNARETETSIQIIPRHKTAKTQIIDAIPSPSENNPLVRENQHTEILDAVPSRVDNGQELDEHNIDKASTDHSDDDLITDDSEISFDNDRPTNVNMNEMPNEEIHFLDPNDNNEEIIVIENGNSDTTIIIENEQLNEFDNTDDVDKEESINVDLLENQDESQDSIDDTDQIISQDELATNNFDTLSDSQTDASDNVFQLVLPDEMENDYEESLPEDNFRAVDSCKDRNEDIVTKANKVETSKQLERNINSDSSETVSLNNGFAEIKSQEEDFIATTLEPKEELEETTESRRAINTDDLQNLSNSLLDLSNKRNQEAARDSEILDCESTEDENLKSSEVNSNESQNALVSDNSCESIENTDWEQSVTTDAEITENNSNATASSEESLNNQNEITDQSIIQEIVDDSNLNEAMDNTEGNTCSTTLDSKSVMPDIVNQEAVANTIEENEMTAEASDSTFNIVPHETSKSAPRSSLFEDFVIQPSSLFGGRPLPEIGNLVSSNRQLPLVDDIQSGISNIFDGSERAADENESTSSEFEPAHDCSGTSPVMSTDASTTNSKAVLPSLNPLENVNFDIFQMNPLSKSKLPGLNLNSYKARLAIPKSLELKPVKLQSSLGRNDGGLLGATLTFGPAKLGSSRTQSSKGSDSLRSPSMNIPSFSELRDTMRARAENFLRYFPLSTTRANTLRGRPAISTLSDNIRSHTENTMKNIQQTLASTLNEAKVKNVGLHGEKYAKPQNLLEDVNDKLHAIHLDLSDRLTSIHDSIVDQSKLPSLQSPVVKSNGILKAKPHITNTRLKSSQPASSTNQRATKPISTKLGSTQSRPLSEQNKFRPYKISKAASSLTPKTVEVPKLQVTSIKPPFSRLLQRDASVILKQSGPITEPIRSRETRPVLRNRFKPFGEVKVSISTTPPPTPTPFKPRSFSTTIKPKLGAKPSLLKSERLRSHRGNDPGRNGPTMSEQLRNSPSDSRGYASEVQSFRIPVPKLAADTKESIGTDSEMASFNGRSPQFRQKPPVQNKGPVSSGIQPTTGSLKPKPPTVGDGTIQSVGKQASTRKAAPPVWSLHRPVLSQARQNPVISEGTKPKPPSVNEGSKAPQPTTGLLTLKPTEADTFPDTRRFSQFRQNPVQPAGTKPTPPLLKKSTASSAQPTAGSLKYKLGDHGTIQSVKNQPSPRKAASAFGSWPKVTDTSFLTKAREALQARYPKLNSKPQRAENSRSSVERGSEDMVRSASEHREVVVAGDQPLRENVKYRCRMVCVREPVE